MRQRDPEKDRQLKLAIQKLIIAVPIFFIIFWWVSPLIHELGHAIVCKAYDREPTIKWNPATYRVDRTSCPPYSDDDYGVRASGGVIGAIVFAIPLFFFRKHLIALFVLLPCIASNGINAVFETFYFDEYSTDFGAYLSTSIAMVSLVPIVWHYVVLPYGRSLAR